MQEKLIGYIKKHKFIRSFRLRIFLIIVVLGFLICTVLRVSFLNNYFDHELNEMTTEATEQMEIVAKHLGTAGYLQDGLDEIVNAELVQLSTVYDGRVLVIDSNFNIIHDTYNLSLGKIMIAKEVMECFRGNVISNYDEQRGYIEVAIPIYILIGQEQIMDANGGPVVDGVILISISTNGLIASYEYLQRQLWIIEILILLIVLAIAFVLSILLTKPFRQVTSALNAVASFEDETPVVSDYIETEEIVEAFNKLRARMKVLDDSRQEFVSNVSHELRTPITSIKVLADSLNVQEDAPVEMYKEFMIDIANEIDREDKIISDLLALVRMDQGKAGLNIEPVNINEMMELIFKRLGPIARKNEVDLIFESRRPITADIDNVKLTLALTNLIENGIKYNKHPGWVKVVLDADHQYMTVDITDCGIGIPEDAKAHIYERFYRVDKSHSREIGGTGLGLAITRKIILLHRGSIEVHSVVDEGTTFSVKIPLSYIVS